MLVLPAGAIEETFFALADAAEDPGILGPSTTAVCRAVALTEAGDWAAASPTQQIPVRKPSKPEGEVAEGALHTGPGLGETSKPKGGVAEKPSQEVSGLGWLTKPEGFGVGPAFGPGGKEAKSGGARDLVTQMVRP